jgi:hypothetical protein
MAEIVLFKDAHFLSGNHLILVDEHLMLLEAHRDALVHLEVLLQAVGGACLLDIEHLAGGEVVDAVVEAELGDLVILLYELFDLLRRF